MERTHIVIIKDEGLMDVFRFRVKFREVADEVLTRCKEAYERYYAMDDKEREEYDSPFDLIEEVVNDPSYEAMPVEFHAWMVD